MLTIVYLFFTGTAASGPTEVHNCRHIRENQRGIQFPSSTISLVSILNIYMCTLGVGSTRRVMCLEEKMSMVMTMWWGGGRDDEGFIESEKIDLSLHVYVCLSISDIFSLNQSTLKSRSLTLKCCEHAESLLYNVHNNRIIHHHGWIFSTGQKSEHKTSSAM